MSERASTAHRLADFGKRGDYFARQIGRWSKQYLASETEKIPEMDRLLEIAWRFATKEGARV